MRNLKITKSKDFEEFLNSEQGKNFVASNKKRDEERYKLYKKQMENCKPVDNYKFEYTDRQLRVNAIGMEAKQKWIDEYEAKNNEK